MAAGGGVVIQGFPFCGMQPELPTKRSEAFRREQVVEAAEAVPRAVRRGREMPVVFKILAFLVRQFRQAIHYVLRRLYVRVMIMPER